MPHSFITVHSTAVHVYMSVVADCCAALSADRHTQACEAVGSCCRQRTLESLLEELSRESAETDIIFKEGAYTHDGEVASWTNMLGHMHA